MRERFSSSSSLCLLRVLVGDPLLACSEDFGFPSLSPSPPSPSPASSAAASSSASQTVSNSDQAFFEDLMRLLRQQHALDAAVTSLPLCLCHDCRVRFVTAIDVHCDIDPAFYPFFSLLRFPYAPTPPADHGFFCAFPCFQNFEAASKFNTTCWPKISHLLLPFLFCSKNE